MKHKFKRLLLAVSLALVASVAFAGTITQTVNNPDGSKTVTVYTTDSNGKVISYYTYTVPAPRVNPPKQQH